LSKFPALLWSVTPNWAAVNDFGAYSSFNWVFVNLFQLAEKNVRQTVSDGAAAAEKASHSSSTTDTCHTYKNPLVSYPLEPPFYNPPSTALSIRHRTKGNFNYGLFLRFSSCLILWRVTIVLGFIFKSPLLLLEFIVQQLHLNSPANFV